MCMCLSFTLNRCFSSSTPSTTSARVDPSILERDLSCGRITTREIHYFFTYAVSTVDQRERVQILLTKRPRVFREKRSRFSRTPGLQHPSEHVKLVFGLIRPLRCVPSLFFLRGKNSAFSRPTCTDSSPRRIVRDHELSLAAFCSFFLTGKSPSSMALEFVNPT